MRNSRFIAGLVAVACVAALPAVAAAHNGSPQKSHQASHHRHGKGNDATRATVRLAPLAGQTAKGVAELKQHAGALSVSLIVSHLTPGAFYAAHIHTGTCAAPGAVALSLPDVYADEHGVATLVTTLPAAADANYIANGFSVDVHAATGATPVISCGDVTVKPATAAARAWLKGTGVKGHAALVQKGTDVTVWVTLHGLTPGAHALHLHAGTCAAPGAVVVSLGDVTAGPDGNASAKVSATSSIPVVGAGFSLDVHAGASAAPAAVVACGDQLATRSKHGH